jgi:hypothetical protein
MPNTCRTDTFMSGIPAGSWVLVMAAVVINPPRLRGAPETRFTGVAADGFAQRNLSESGNGKKPAPQSKFRWTFMEIVAGHDFWKAALQILPAFRRGAASATG